MRRSRLIVLAVTAALVAACAPATNTTTTTTPSPEATPPATSAPSAPATAGVQVFRATLDTINRSGVTGDATVTAEGSTLRVEMSATGMVPGQTHAQHIHGFPGGRPSTCPPAAAEGTVTQEPDAEKSYGPVLVPLEPFPTADGSGRISYTATVNAVSVEPTIPVLPLAGREIVLHGLMIDGTYAPSVPVACGTLEAVTTTTPGGQAPGTGSGGTESTGTTGGGGGTGGSGGGTGATTTPGY